MVPADNVVCIMLASTMFSWTPQFHLNTDHIPDLNWLLTTNANSLLVHIPECTKDQPPVDDICTYTQFSISSITNTSNVN